MKKSGPIRTGLEVVLISAGFFLIVSAFLYYTGLLKWPGSMLEPFLTR